MCVGAELELNSAGLWPSRNWVWYPLLSLLVRCHSHPFCHCLCFCLWMWLSMCFCLPVWSSSLVLFLALVFSFYFNIYLVFFLVFCFYIFSLLFFYLIVLVKLVIISSLPFFLSVVFVLFIPLSALEFLCSCGALSCLVSLCCNRVPVLACSHDFLPLVHPAWYLVHFEPSLQSTSIWASLLLFCQLMSRLSQWCSLAVSVYCVPVVESHAHLTTLLYLCLVIKPCHSLSLQLPKKLKKY